MDLSVHYFSSLYDAVIAWCVLLLADLLSLSGDSSPFLDIHKSLSVAKWGLNSLVGDIALSIGADRLTHATFMPLIKSLRRYIMLLVFFLQLPSHSYLLPI